MTMKIGYNAIASRARLGWHSIRLYVILSTFILFVSWPKITLADVLKAPFDSYICIDKDMLTCANEVLGPEYERVFRSKEWEIRNDGTIRLTGDFSIQRLDREDGKVFGCASSGRDLASAFRFNQQMKVVFFSVDLFVRLSETVIRIEQATEACNRIHRKYIVQVKDMNLQDSLSEQQRQYQEVMNELDHLSWRLTIERDRTLCFSLPSDLRINKCLENTFMPDWIQGNTPSISLANAAASLRINVLVEQEAARKHAWAILEREILDESKVLSLNLANAEMEMARILLMLRFSSWDPEKKESKLRWLATDGGQVSKGDSVLEYRKK